MGQAELRTIQQSGRSHVFSSLLFPSYFSLSTSSGLSALVSLLNGKWSASILDYEILQLRLLLISWLIQCPVQSRAA